MIKKKEQKQVTELPKIVWEDYLTFIDNGSTYVYYIRIVKTTNGNVMEFKDNKTDAMKTKRWLPIRQIYR